MLRIQFAMCCVTKQGLRKCEWKRDIQSQTWMGRNSKTTTDWKQRKHWNRISTMDDARKHKRRRLRSSSEAQSLVSASHQSSARPKVAGDDAMTIMDRPINIHLNYVPPSTTVCIDSETSIRSATLREIMKREDIKECPVCFEDFGKSKNNNNFHFFQQAAAPAASGDIVATPCEHYFHRHCLLESLQHSTKCPICRKSVAAPRGKCPPATMTVSLMDGRSYHAYCGGLTAQLIYITYSIPSGTQAAYHESPGQHFSGTSRVAYLQNDVESRQLLQRLCFAFMHGLTFAGTFVP
jgi:hypothetical protein